MKKLKEIWDYLFKRPIIKNIVITSTAKDALVVKHLVTDTPYTSQALGISKERCSEIEKLVKIGFVKHDNTIAVAEEVSQQLNHANKLFLAITMINHEQQKLMNPMPEILGSIFGRKKSD